VLGADGKWVRASRAPDGTWVWDAVGSQPPAPVAYTRGWRGGAPPRRDASDCVLADHRGIVGNWVAAPCDRPVVGVFVSTAAAAAAAWHAAPWVVGAWQTPTRWGRRGGEPTPSLGGDASSEEEAREWVSAQGQS